MYSISLLKKYFVILKINQGIVTHSFLIKLYLKILLLGNTIYL
jgi:hypothetical protein